MSPVKANEYLSNLVDVLTILRSKVIGEYVQECKLIDAYIEALQVSQVVNAKMKSSSLTYSTDTEFPGQIDIEDYIRDLTE